MKTIKTKLIIVASIVLCFCCSISADICSICKGARIITVTCDACNGHGYVASKRNIIYKRGLTKPLTINYIDDDGEIKTKTKSFSVSDKDDPDKFNAPTWCLKCHRGMKVPGKWGSGKIMVSCSTCKGVGYIKNIRSNSSKDGISLKEIRLTKDQWRRVCLLIETKGKVDMFRSGIRLIVQ